MAVGIAALTFLISAAARSSIAPSRNRIALTSASWSAAACVAHARAALADGFEQEGVREAGATATTWDWVDRTLKASPPPTELGCQLEARAVGSRLDVNASDEATLARLFRKVGMPAARADSVAATVALRKPYVDRRELRLVRDLQTLTSLDSVLDVEPGPIALDRAPAAALALLPGFTEETVERVLDARARDAPISTFHELSQLLSPEMPDASARLPGLAVFQPTAWVITARATNGMPPITAVVEVRLARSRGGTVITRWRSWIE